MLKKAFRKLNKVISLMLAVIMCIFMLPMQTFAAEDDEDIKWVEFENEFSAVISIDVTKNVTGDPAPVNIIDVDGEQVIERDRFMFRLLLGNDEASAKPAKEQEYKLYNEDMQEIHRWLAKDGVTVIYTTGNEASPANCSEYPFTTDKTGRFMLYDKETASFEGIVLNKYYKVEEILDEAELIDMPAGKKRGTYTQLTPDQSGKLTEKGASALFKNQYTAPSDKGELKIYKRVNLPDSEKYIFPEDNLGHEFKGIFNYQLKINGTLQTNLPFSVYDVETGDFIRESQIDSEGNFQICGDEYAHFKDIPKNAQYDIYETQFIDDSVYKNSVWWAIGQDANPKPGYLDVRRGTTPDSVNFMNTRYSFVVSKFLKTDDSDKTADPEATFNFVLTKENGDRMEANYYLFNSTGSMVDETLHTAVNGEFKLKFNQRAVFVDVPQGTVYNVREEVDSSYRQFSPKENDGYVNNTVVDSIEEKIFINELLDNSGLSVSKVVKDESGTIAKDKEYIFLLSKLDGTGNYVPVANATFTVNINGEDKSKATDANGLFTLRDNQTAYFRTLLPGSYQVEEIIKKEDKKYFSVDIIESEIMEEGEEKTPVSGIEISKLHSEKDIFTDPDEVKLAAGNDYDKYIVSKIPVESEKSVNVKITNKVKEYYFNILKTIHVDDITGEYDKAQAFVFKIEYLGKDKDNAPIRTFYTNIKCTNALNSHELITDDADSKIGSYYMFSGMTTVKTDLPGWYRISEVKEWSITDYDYTFGSNSYIAGNRNDGSFYDAGNTEDKSYVYFKIEDEYSDSQKRAGLPTAGFTNVESIYAYRSGQAYFDNILKVK